MNSDNAKENALTVLQAKKILEEWADIIEASGKDGSEAREAAQAVAKAHALVAEVYPELAVFAAALDMKEEEAEKLGTDLTGRDDRAFF